MSYQQISVDLDILKSPHADLEIKLPYATVKMLGLGGERLTQKVLDHYLHHNLVMPLLLWVFFLIYSS